MKYLATSLILMFGIFSGVYAQSAEVPTITAPDVAAQLAQGAVFIDVREEREVAVLAYDLPAVQNLPLSELANRLDEVPRDHPLIIACRSGNRSLQAAQLLQEQGYQDVKNLAGGIIAWGAGGFPVREAAAPATGTPATAPMSCGGNGKGKAGGCCAKKATGTAAATTCGGGKAKGEGKAKGGGKACCAGGKS